MASMNIAAQTVTAQARNEAFALAKQLGVCLINFPTDKAPLNEVIERAAQNGQNLHYSAKVSPQGICYFAAKGSGNGASGNANINGPFSSVEVAHQAGWLFGSHYMNMKRGTPGHITNPTASHEDGEGYTLVMNNGQQFRITVTELKQPSAIVTPVTPAISKTATAK